MRGEAEAAVRDLESVDDVQALLGEIDGLPDGEVAPLQLEPIAKAIKAATKRLRSARRSDDRAVLSSVIAAASKSLLDLSTVRPSGLLDARGNEIEAAAPDEGGGDPAGLRLLLFVAIRRYRRVLGSKTWTVLLGLYNASQADRPAYRIKNEDDVRRLTYDRLPSGELAPPTRGGGFNLPAAHVLRIAGYDL